MTVPSAPNPLPALYSLLETQRAFDSIAADYDGPRHNNALLQRMRTTFWRVIDANCSQHARLLDLGCGTGIDAVHLARSGRAVVATDWSPQMIARTQARAARYAQTSRVEARHLGVQELHHLSDSFDAAYSNFGPLNCAPDLGQVARECARLVRPGGVLIFSVMGRICPWEVLYYRWKRRPERARIRQAVGPVAVTLNGQTVWTRYYRPREFYAPFAASFALSGYQALSLFVPPPYLIAWYERFPRMIAALGWLDDAVGSWPGLRNAGDHFLMLMTRRPEPAKVPNES